MKTDINFNLKENITRFLNDKFVFRKLEIHLFFENKKPPIFWIQKSHYSKEIDSEEACALLDNQVFYDWQVYDKDSVTYLLGEFELWNSINDGPRLRKREAKKLIKNLIEEADLVATVKFNPVLKGLISEGRHKVSGVIPLNSTDEGRVDIDAKEGEVYYLCKDYQRPYIANPCYIIKSSGSGSYRVMFFTNVASQFQDTKKTEINGYGFTTVFANELGTTPEQAVRQRQG